MNTAIVLAVGMILAAAGVRAWIAMGRELHLMASEDAWYLEQTRLMRQARRQMTDDEWAAFDEWRASLEVRS